MFPKPTIRICQQGLGFGTDFPAAEDVKVCISWRREWKNKWAGALWGRNPQLFKSLGWMNNPNPSLISFTIADDRRRLISSYSYPHYYVFLWNRPQSSSSALSVIRIRMTLLILFNPLGAFEKKKSRKGEGWERFHVICIRMLILLPPDHHRSASLLLIRN